MAFLSLVLAVAPGRVAAAGSAPTAPDAVTRVERGLRPAVVLQGSRARPRRLADEMTRLHVPGVSVAVLHDGRLAWARGYGVTRAGGPPVTPDTLFQAGSISKPVTALAALRLVEQGLLGLDRDVNDDLRGTPLPTPPGARVTLRQLLSHTAGTTVHGFPGYAAGEPVPTVEDVLAGRPPANTAPVVVDTAPGTAWRYSGGGYTVVQKLLADATGRRFADVLRETVLEPAGMARSSFVQPLPPDALAAAAWPHDGQGRPIAGGPHTYPELAAAGLWSTPSELARYAVAVRDAARGAPEALLSRALATTLLTPGQGDYGLGVEVHGPADNRNFSHGGSNAGYENYFTAYAGTGDGAVIMTNGAQGNELALEVVRAVAAAYGWPGYRSVVRASRPIPAATRRRLAGEYDIPHLGGFTIGRDGAGLWISLKGDAREPLYAASADTYFVQSQDLVLRVRPGPGAVTGRIVSGPFDVPFSRAAAGSKP